MFKKNWFTFFVLAVVALTIMTTAINCSKEQPTASELNLDKLSFEVGDTCDIITYSGVDSLVVTPCRLMDIRETDSCTIEGEFASNINGKIFILRTRK